MIAQEAKHFQTQSSSFAQVTPILIGPVRIVTEFWFSRTKDPDSGLPISKQPKLRQRLGSCELFCSLLLLFDLLFKWPADQPLHATLPCINQSIPVQALVMIISIRIPQLFFRGFIIEILSLGREDFFYKISYWWILFPFEFSLHSLGL